MRPAGKAQGKAVAAHAADAEERALGIGIEEPRLLSEADAATRGEVGALTSSGNVPRREGSGDLMQAFSSVVRRTSTPADAIETFRRLTQARTLVSRTH